MARQSTSPTRALLPAPAMMSGATSYIAAANPAIASSTKPMKRVDIMNLMSPPEPASIEAFSTHRPRNIAALPRRHEPRMEGPLSPPVSPFYRSHDRHGSFSSGMAKDPILYPVHDVSVSPTRRPLFSRENSVESQRIVNDHVDARPASLFRAVAPPQNEEYELILSFKSQIMESYTANPRRWLQRERAQLLEDQKARARHRPLKLQAILPAKQQAIRSHAQRVSKPAKSPKSTVAPTPRPVRARVTSPRIIVIGGRSGSPDPKAPRVVAPHREDKDFNAIPDFCPPLNTLSNPKNRLKTDWRGNPVDLGNDPHRHLLHPDEVVVAGTLRLDCATYLTSKRRIFQRRLECLGKEKVFRKTDAQQACNIDVNKASKLWQAFHEVGWLDEKWVRGFR